MLLEMWWAIGSMLAATLALAVLPNSELCDCHMICMFNNYSN